MIKLNLQDPLVLQVCTVCFIWSSWQMSVPIHQAGECLCQFKFLHFAHCCFMENDEKWTTCLPWYEHSMTSVEHLRLAHSTRILSGIFSAVLMRVEVMEAILIQTLKFPQQSQFSLHKILLSILVLWVRYCSGMKNHGHCSLEIVSQKSLAFVSFLYWISNHWLFFGGRDIIFWDYGSTFS